MQQFYLRYGLVYWEIKRREQEDWQYPCKTYFIHLNYKMYLSIIRGKLVIFLKNIHLRKVIRFQENVKNIRLEKARVPVCRSTFLFLKTRRTIKNAAPFGFLTPKKKRDKNLCVFCILNYSEQYCFFSSQKNTIFWFI